MWVCLGRCWGSSRIVSPLGEVTLGPFSLFFPSLPAFPPRVSCQASVSCCPSLAPAYVSVGRAGGGAGQPERLCCPQGPPARHQVTLGRGHGHQFGAPQHPAPHPGAGDLLVASQPCTVARRCRAPRQGDTVHCGTEQGCKFSADGVLAGCSTRRTVSPGPMAKGCATGRSLQGS